MESWCFDSLDKGYVSSETLPTSDSIMTAKNGLMEWEFKPSFSYDNGLLVTTTQNSMEVSGFPEVGFAENMRNLVSSSGVGDMVSTGMVTSNAISGDEDSSSKLSSSVVDSNSRESSLIDLKLGGFGDNNRNSNPSKTARALSSAESSTPVMKRGRLSSLSSQKAYCQVYGCNKDLSSAKDYHKRHRVCDAHSKTSTVIVNGIEQRFCQQCSRFHLLAEFDDGKRSCRKRLAGHNQRRRKTRLSFNGSRVGRSLYSFADSGSIGGKFPGSTLTTSSFICQDILPRNTSQPESHETNGWGKYVKAEDEEVLYAQKSGFLYPKSFAPPYLVDNTNTVGPGNIFSETTTAPYPSELVSRSLFQTNSLGPYNSSLFDAASTVEGCALSLLSSGIPTARPSISNPVYSLSEISVVENNGLHLGSEGHFPCKDGNTIDLLQLSSQLHRVETQRQTAPVKEEIVDGFCCLRMT